MSDKIVRRSALLVVVGLGMVVARLHELVPAIRVVRPVILVVLALLFVTLAARKRVPQVRGVLSDTSVRMVLAYWAWMAMTIPLSIFRGQSVEIVTNLAPVILFALLVAAQPPSAALLATVNKGLVLLGGVYGLLLVFFAQPLMDVDGVRYFLTPSLDPNDAAAFLAICAPMALAGAKGVGTKRWKLVCWSALGCIAVGVIRTGSRGGFIALGVGLALVLLSGRGLKLIFSVVGALILLLIIQQVVPQEMLPARLQSITDVSEDYNMTAYGGRIAIWKRGVRYVGENPVLGVGVGGFAVREGEQMLEDHVTGKWSAPHSAYVQSFAELGVIGGLLFTALVVLSARRVIRIYRNPSPITGIAHPEYFAAILAFAVSAAFLSHAYFWGFFALVGLSALVGQTLDPRTRTSR